MSKVLYTAEATATGDRMKGNGRTSDGNLDVEIRPPQELGGDGTGTNPEQLFAVGYAACFENAMSLVARRMKEETGEARVDSKVGLHPTEERGFKLSVELHVTLPGVDDEKAVEITRVRAQGLPLLERHEGQHRRDADRQRSAGRLAGLRTPPGPSRPGRRRTGP